MESIQGLPASGLGTIIFCTACVPSAHNTSPTPILVALLGSMLHGGPTSAFEYWHLYSRQRWKAVDCHKLSTSIRTLASAPESASCFLLVPAARHSSVAANVFLIRSTSVCIKGSCSLQSAGVTSSERFRKGQSCNSGCNCVSRYC